MKASRSPQPIGSIEKPDRRLALSRQNAVQTCSSSRRERRRFELGLDLGAPLRLECLPLEEALEDVAVGNAVLERRQREILFSERPQLVAEG